MKIHAALLWHTQLENKLLFLQQIHPYGKAIWIALQNWISTDEFPGDWVVQIEAERHQKKKKTQREAFFFL